MGELNLLAAPDGKSPMTETVANALSVGLPSPPSGSKAALSTRVLGEDGNVLHLPCPIW